MLFIHDKIMFECESEQETINISAQFYRENFETAIKGILIINLVVLSEIILKPKFIQTELDKTIENFLELFEEESKNPILSTSFQNKFILESCFDNNLGASIHYVNKETKVANLEKFLKKFIRPENLVISCAGVSHSTLEELIKKYFHFDVHNEKIEIQSSVWSPKDLRYEFLESPQEVLKQNIPSLSSMNVSFPGFSNSDENIYAAHVLETLMVYFI
jgi:predicted Zn-dependent peptidase